MLMPALAQARREAHKSNCRANLHNIGLGMYMWTGANKDEYPYAYNPDLPVNAYCNAYGRLVGAGYVDDTAIFSCPATPDRLRVEKQGWAGATQPGTWKHVLNSDYGYDNGRVDKNSLPGRGVMADLPRHLLSNGSGSYVVDNSHPLVDFNHKLGVNLLYFDNSLEWVQVSEWAPTNPWASDPDAVQWVISHPDAGNLVRYGFVDNPKTDTHSNPADPDDPMSDGEDDVDDIYLLEDSLTPNVFVMETDSNIERAGYRGQDGSTIPASSDDEAITPERTFLRATGWAESEL